MLHIVRRLRPKPLSVALLDLYRGQAHRSTFNSLLQIFSARRISSTSASPSPTNHDPTTSTDILVIGAGVAGLSASISALEKNRNVTLLDSSHGGGATSLSGGFIYAGGGTPQQREAGYDDSPENMYLYLKAEIKDAVDDETLRRFCESSVKRQQWLERHGIEFQGSLCPHKTSFPTDEHYLAFTGNENTYPYRDIANPAPRGHRVVMPGFSGGLLAEKLSFSAKKLGVRFMPASKAERILLGQDGSVSGVQFRSLDPSSRAFRRHKLLSWAGMKSQLAFPGLAGRFFDRAGAIWEKDARVSTIKSSSVILAAGGFAFNEEMRKQYVPEYSNVAPLGTRGDDGSGIKLGQAVGGSVGNMNSFSAWRFIYPPTAFLEGVVVSRHGKRFIAEDVYGALLSEKMIREHEGTAYLILDSSQWAKANEQAFEQVRVEMLVPVLNWLRWEHVRASSIQELSKKIGIPESNLQDTITAYNDAISQGKSDPLNKGIEYCTPLSNAPYYAIDISPRRDGFSRVMGLTLGGLRVDGQSGLVMRDDNTTIKGLYAAGRNAVGICSNGYVSGLSLADGVFSGIRAGEHAAGTNQGEK